MKTGQTFENFPLWMVAVSDSVVIGIYAIGVYIMFNVGIVWGWLYLLCCLLFEIRLMRGSCIHCYYYGKCCGLGRGKLAGLFFKKGDPAIFLKKQLTWKDLVPDFLISLIPFLFGVYLLLKGFNWINLALLAMLFLLTTAGNGFIRGNIACKFCKQRQFGCPAEKLFRKT